jgi:hypothetical protein
LKQLESSYSLKWVNVKMHWHVIVNSDLKKARAEGKKENTNAERTAVQQRMGI